MDGDISGTGIGIKISAESLEHAKEICAKTKFHLGDPVLEEGRNTQAPEA